MQVPAQVYLAQACSELVPHAKEVPAADEEVGLELAPDVEEVPAADGEVGPELAPDEEEGLSFRHRRRYRRDLPEEELNFRHRCHRDYLEEEPSFRRRHYRHHDSQEESEEYREASEESPAVVLQGGTPDFHYWVELDDLCEEEAAHFFQLSCQSHAGVPRFHDRLWSEESPCLD